MIKRDKTLSPASPFIYQPPPKYDKMIQERDIMVPMRDGVRLCIDIYRPDVMGEKFPALLAISEHNKDLQTPDLARAIPPQPAWSAGWTGVIEAGDTDYLVSRGYVHVIGNLRGIGKSENGGSPQWDLYDLIEWIAKQSWCDGNIGMIGISGYSATQWQAAIQQPPHLKAIFPYDATGAYGIGAAFRDTYPGGVLNAGFYLLGTFSVKHEVKDKPGPLPSEIEHLLNEALENPDYKIYPNLYNVLTMKGQNMPGIFNLLINPYEEEDIIQKTDEKFEKIRVPAYTGSGWYSYTYKVHMQGCQHWYHGINVPKKLIFTGPSVLERPFHSFHSEILKWYDYWLKGVDTGIMDEPPIKIWVMGANEWCYGEDWPLPETKWTKYYLHSWERLRTEPFTISGRDGYDQPDAFVQMPLTQTREIDGLRYMTDPLPEDTLIIGPISLTLYASIDQEDTNWIAILKDIGPDMSVRTAREGEIFPPSNVPERELTRGWLKASYRLLDPERSEPWKPWHQLTRKAWKPVVPGEINKYEIEILSTANLFRKGHRICLDITCLDLPTGVGGATNAEYIPYHICSSKTTLHKIYHNEKYPSCLLLPIIPMNSPK